ncbi:hypothetical protein Pcinc_021947 [Petrolisthes cinctipes]|uniref:Uncharacterized protein n=1 Tax=Petrolisthes cinctipes TaxID=88211 RepID=A0AAE1KED7_PETCI|nr:hypothetical protein Pcinc_021947 [Petrolisthes cinctipes]
MVKTKTNRFQETLSEMELQGTSSEGTQTMRGKVTKNLFPNITYLIHHRGWGHANYVVKFTLQLRSVEKSLLCRGKDFVSYFAHEAEVNDGDLGSLLNCTLELNDDIVDFKIEVVHNDAFSLMC